MQEGIIYAETVVFSPPTQYLNDAPYQLAIVQTEDNNRVTVRIEGERIAIGQRVILIEERGGVQWWRGAS